MGPDLIGIAWATAFLLAVLSVYALIDRLVCGAWEALNGSPGWGLVTGMIAWAREPEAERVVSSPASPGGSSPISPEPVATERLSRPRIGGAAFVAAGA